MTWKELEEAYREAQKQPGWKATMEAFEVLAVLFFVVAPIAALIFSIIAA